jgi:hypothetical protein
MLRLCAQGDILIERVDNAPVTGRVIQPLADASAIVAKGHHHRIFGSVTLYHDAALAREIPSGLYVGHVQVDSPAARLEHEEHAPITLEQVPIASAGSGSWSPPTSASIRLGSDLHKV